jgi:predicted PolB exonuclease-like 3'-5' exonuclease
MRFQSGNWRPFHNYCETDAANTYLVFLRFQLLRGLLTEEQYAREIDLAYDTLARSAAVHWQEFIRAWQRESSAVSDPHAAVG